MSYKLCPECGIELRYIAEYEDTGYPWFCPETGDYFSIQEIRKGSSRIERKK